MLVELKKKAKSADHLTGGHQNYNPICIWSSDIVTMQNKRPMDHIAHLNRSSS